MMADYALDFDTWGLTVSAGKVTEVSDGIAEMKQRIGIAIKTHLGEKLLDVTLGLPWMERIMVKNPSLDRITSDIRTYLLTRVEGVTGVLELRPVFDPALRKLTIYLNVETTAGVTGPFNLTV
jgi:hypothetical protein